MGDLLRGRYEVLAVLGGDGATEIVRAVDRQHGQTVVLRVRRLASGDDREALLADSRTLLGLRPHPALPTARDDFFVDDRYVLVMDWAEGANLGQRLAEQGDPGLPVGSVLGWLETVGAAVDHLHAQRPPVVHGDIRPDNIVVDADGRVAVVFGTRSLGGGDRAERGNPSSDVCALAATAVCLLTGRPPAPGAPATWDGVAPELAKRLDRVLRSALDRDPARPPVTAGELVARLQAAREGALPTGVVTFALTDIEGSTELWESHPDVMVGVIARHYQLAGQIAEAHNGRMPRSQGEGDSTLSAFGRATDAVAAALDFQRVLRREAWPEGIRLRVRAGLHTGEAQVEQGDYFGATVSRTARLRALARGGQVVVSRATAEVVADNLPTGVTLRDVGRFELKGLSRAEQVFELCCDDLIDVPSAAVEPAAELVRTRVPFPTVLEAGTSGFVGRGRALDMIRQVRGRAIETSCRRVVLVGGEPGIGKSWLAAASAREASGTGATVLYGRCYEENLIPYQPFVELVRHYLRCCPADEVRLDLGGMGGSLGRLIPDIALRFPELPAPIRAEPDTERYLMFEAVNELLVRVASRAPVLLVIDDLHWADRPTLALLEHLARDADAASVVVLGTYRIGEVLGEHPLVATMSNLRREGLVDELTLSGMDENEVGSIVQGVADLDARPGFVHSLCHETEGNPFFVSEICRHVAESSGGSGAFTLAALGVPAGVKQVIGRRVARLDEAVGRTLTAAAVIGREFELDLVVAVTGAVEDDAIDVLDHACAARLIEEAGSVGRYSFVHALTRETLHDSLSSTRRAKLHLRVAEAIEARRAKSLEEHLGALAYHYAMAGTDVGKAVEYAGRAGTQSLARLAHEEAAAQFERGLSLLSALDSDRCDLLLGLAEARHRAGDVVGAQTLFGQVSVLARALGDPVRLARAAVGSFRGHVMAHPSWHDPLIERLEEALAKLPADDSPLRARVLAALSLELHFTPEKKRGLAISAAGIEMARRVGDDEALAFALACGHTAIFDPGHVDARLRLASELIEVGARAGTPELALIGHVQRACDLLELARVDEARSEAAIAAAIVTQLGQPMQRYFVLWLETTLALLEGRLGDAERLSHEALDIAVAANHPDAMVVFGCQAAALGWQSGNVSHVVEPAEQWVAESEHLTAWRAAVALMQALDGRHDHAREHVRALASDFDFGFDSVWTATLVVLAEACRILDQRDLAEPIYQRLAPYAERLCVVSTNVCEMGPVGRSLGVLATLMGDYARAERHFVDARALAERIGAPPHVARTRVDHARMLVARRQPGDAERAQQELTAGAILARDIGMVGLLADIDDLQADLSNR